MTSARLTCRPNTRSTKFTIPSDAAYRFQSLILSVAATTTSVPTKPEVEVTIATTSLVLRASASSTPIRPITYSPSVTPTSVCLTTSRAERLKRVMSGVITAPTMKPPATIAVPSMSDSVAPAGCAAVRSPSEWRHSSATIDQPASARKAGTAM